MRLLFPCGYITIHVFIYFKTEHLIVLGFIGQAHLAGKKLLGPLCLHSSGLDHSYRLQYVCLTILGPGF